MDRKLWFVAALFLCAGCSRQEKGIPMDISSHVKYEAPSGWLREDRSFGADRTVLFRRGDYELRVQLMGGEGSVFADMDAYLEDLQRRTAGRLKIVTSVPAAGADRTMYVDRYKVETNAPDGKVIKRWVYDESLVFKAGDRFLVIGASQSSEAEINKPALPPEWPAFRQNLQLLK